MSLLLFIDVPSLLAPIHSFVIYLLATVFVEGFHALVTV